MDSTGPADVVSADRALPHNPYLEVAAMKRTKGSTEYRVVCDTCGDHGGPWDHTRAWEEARAHEAATGHTADVVPTEGN